MNYKTFALFIFVFTTNAVHATVINYSNTYLSSWNGIISHEVGSPTSSFDVYSSSTGSVGPVIESNSTSYASGYASSSEFSLVSRSTVDATQIGSLGLDYAISEASARFETDMILTGGTGLTSINIDAYYNESLGGGEGVFLYGQHRIRIFDENNELVFAYLRGVSDESDLDSVMLNHNTVYRFVMLSTAYTNVDVGYTAYNFREFGANITAMASVPAPGTALLLGIGLLSLMSISGKGKRTLSSFIRVNTENT